MSARTGPAFAVFDSPIGHCAVAWSPRGLVRFLLPEESRALTEARLLELLPDAHPARPRRWVAELIARVRRHLGGAFDDFADVPLDAAHIPPFFSKVYEALRKVRPGATTTYGALGRKVGGSTGDARAVGAAMARNPFALIVLCHRVVAADGTLHGFSAHGGVATKAKLLALEGLRPPQQVPLFRDTKSSPPPPSARAKVTRRPRARPRTPTPDG